MDTHQTSNQDSALTVSDRFSFHRMMEVAAFHKPNIEKQILIYLIVSVISAICTLLPVHAIAQAALYTITWTILGLLVYLAPCVLAKSGDSRIIERLLPASVAEKFWFRILYFLVLVPVITYLLPYTAAYLYLQIPSIQTEEFNQIIDILFDMKLSLRCLGLFTSGACILTCLYTVTRARSNRILKGILSVFAVQIAGGILGAIWGLSSAFMAGFRAGITGTEPSDEIAQQELVKKVAGQMFDSPYYWIVIGITIAYFLLMLILNYRILKKQNL